MQDRHEDRRSPKGWVGFRSIAAAIVLAWPASLALPAVAWGQTLDAPVLVRADEAGSFCYDAIFTAGPGGEEIFVIAIVDLGNTNVGVIFDEPFCSLFLAEGEQLSFTTFALPDCPGISGFLLDPAAEGAVSISVSSVFGDLICPGGSGESYQTTTTILPFSPSICIDNSECAAGSYCEEPIGACGGEGTCVQQPELCPRPSPTDRVCGCDGDTYRSDCEAARAGVSVALDGPCELEVEIDIKPGSDPNAINPLGQGLIPVALLGAIDVDVMDVDPETLAFGPDGAPIFHEVGPHVGDVNDDGFTDLVVHFQTQDTGIAWGQTQACVAGETFNGTPIESCDSIVTVGSCGIGFELALLLPLLLWLRRRRLYAGA